jgi:hypothetical protein
MGINLYHCELNITELISDVGKTGVSQRHLAQTTSEIENLTTQTTDSINKDWKNAV